MSLDDDLCEGKNKEYEFLTLFLFLNCFGRKLHWLAATLQMSNEHVLAIIGLVLWIDFDCDSVCQHTRISCWALLSVLSPTPFYQSFYKLRAPSSFLHEYLKSLLWRVRVFSFLWQSNLSMLCKRFFWLYLCCWVVWFQHLPSNLRLLEFAHQVWTSKSSFGVVEKKKQNRSVLSLHSKQYLELSLLGIQKEY